MGKGSTPFSIFIENFNQVAAGEYEYVSGYTRMTKKITVRHIECNREFYPVASAFINTGSRCPHCRNDSRPKLNEDYRQEVIALTNGEYEPVSTYVNCDEYIMMRHNICGNVYSTKPIFFKKGNRCPQCNPRREITHEEFVQRVYDIHKDGITVIGEYEKLKQPIRIRNNKCGHEYDMIAHSLQFKTVSERKKCPVCKQLKIEAKEKRALDRLQYKLKKQIEVKPKKERVTDHESFIKKVRELTGEEFDVLGQYERADKKIEIKHNKCDRTFMVTPSGFINRPTCRPCSEYRNHAYTTEEFSILISEKTSGEYEVIGEYINGLTPVTVKHKCGHIYDITPDTLRLKGFGSMCPACSNAAVSLGEVRIKNFLDSHNIKYKQQYGIDECRNKHRLSFDFAVFHREGLLKCLIEFDGEQHFNVIEYFGKESTERTQHNDRIKNEYCKKNNIHLIRIPYWERDNIDEILTNELSSYKIYIQNGMTAS